MEKIGGVQAEVTAPASLDQARASSLSRSLERRGMVWISPLTGGKGEMYECWSRCVLDGDQASRVGVWWHLVAHSARVKAEGMSQSILQWFPLLCGCGQTRGQAGDSACGRGSGVLGAGRTGSGSETPVPQNAERKGAV